MAEIIFIFITLCVTTMIYGVYNVITTTGANAQLDRLNDVEKAMRRGARAKSFLDFDPDKEGAAELIETEKLFKKQSKSYYHIKISEAILPMLLLACALGGGIYWLFNLTGVFDSTILLLTICGSLLVLYTPRWLYWKRVRDVKSNITYNFPNSIDLMNICLQAGISFDQSFMYVAQEIKDMTPILSMEYNRVTQEINAGKKREAALRDLAARLEVDEVHTVVSNIVQAEKLGGSVANNLKTQAGTLRDKYKQNVRTRIARVPIKMIFPMVFCMIPAILILILGPAFVRITEYFVAS